VANKIYCIDTNLAKELKRIVLEEERKVRLRKECFAPWWTLCVVIIKEWKIQPLPKNT
jgi:hypothetical protein